MTREERPHAVRRRPRENASPPRAGRSLLAPRPPARGRSRADSHGLSRPPARGRSRADSQVPFQTVSASWGPVPTSLKPAIMFTSAPMLQHKVRVTGGAVIAPHDTRARPGSRPLPPPTLEGRPAKATPATAAATCVSDTCVTRVLPGRRLCHTRQWSKSLLELMPPGRGHLGLQAPACAVRPGLGLRGASGPEQGVDGGGPRLHTHHGVGRQALVTRRQTRLRREPGTSRAQRAEASNRGRPRLPAGRRPGPGHAYHGRGGTAGCAARPASRGGGPTRAPTASTGHTGSAGEGRAKGHPGSAGRRPFPGRGRRPRVAPARDPGRLVTRTRTPCPRRARRLAGRRGLQLPARGGRLSAASFRILLCPSPPVRASAFCHECIMGSFS